MEWGEAKRGGALVVGFFFHNRRKSFGTPLKTCFCVYVPVMAGGYQCQTDTGGGGGGYTWYGCKVRKEMEGGKMNQVEKRVNFFREIKRVRLHVNRFRFFLFICTNTRQLCSACRGTITTRGGVNKGHQKTKRRIMTITGFINM